MSQDASRIGKLILVPAVITLTVTLLRQALCERFALHEFHDDVVGPILVADVVERADVRVVEGLELTRFRRQPRYAARFAQRRHSTRRSSGGRPSRRPGP